MKPTVTAISNVSLVGIVLFGSVLSFQPLSSFRSTAPSNKCPVRWHDRLPHAVVPKSSSSASLSMTTNESTSLPSMASIWKSLENMGTVNFNGDVGGFEPTGLTSPGVGFLMAWNNGDFDGALALVAEDDDNRGGKVEFEDTDFPTPWRGKAELERMVRLIGQVPSRPTLVVDAVVYDPAAGREGVAFHLEKPSDGSFWKKGAAFFELAKDESTSSPLQITKAFVVKENQKGGETSLKILQLASEISSIAAVMTKSSPTKKTPTETVSSSFPSSSEMTATSPKRSLPDSKFFSPWSPKSSLASSPTLPEQYFDSWNKRDMKRACSLFADDIVYDDTAFPEPFSGRDALERHLNVCARCMPTTFSFIVDDLVNANDKFMVRWHVENGSEELLYTRGCSLYEISNGRIVRGTDWKEPAVFKTAGVSLFVQSTWSKLQEEPARWFPLAVWIAYMYVVFFSDWFFGLPVQSLEIRTWEEVRDLSLNFFLVSPILGLPFSPVVHPGLEGIFNLLLSWAALFAGFLSDDRPRKPNLLPMLPIVVGMQFLTSAFLLPYLVTRSTEEEEAECNVSLDELTPVAQAAESRFLGLAMGLVGTGSIVWGLLARAQDFGGFPERFWSLMELLSIDRVGSSFVVDLAIFGLFQGWLVDDDLKRRRMDRSSPLAIAAKWIPFFGLASYLTLRSELPNGGGLESLQRRSQPDDDRT